MVKIALALGPEPTPVWTLAKQAGVEYVVGRHGFESDTERKCRAAALELHVTGAGEGCIRRWRI